MRQAAYVIDEKSLNSLRLQALDLWRTRVDEYHNLCTLPPVEMAWMLEEAPRLLAAELPAAR